MVKLCMRDKGLISIKNVKQLESATNCIIPDQERDDLQKIIDKYPVRLSKHVIRQIQKSEKIAYQYMPFIGELDTAGLENTWVGAFHDGVLEQMYPNRVIFLINMTCPVYCRFCFRKHKDLRNAEPPVTSDIKAAVSYVERHRLIKEILITGGDPFLNKKNLKTSINGLMQIGHVQTLRLATRSISYFPDLFLNNNRYWMGFLIEKNRELQHHGKTIEIATHFIHPHEISPQSLEIISQFVTNGIVVYIQTPLLHNCNDTGPELKELFQTLRGAGAQMHYIFMPCSPIHGNKQYTTPVSKGFLMADYLRAHLSDRAVPKICTATSIGKIDWFTSGWAVEKDKNQDDFIWIRTPYSHDYFHDIALFTKNMDNIRTNNEGTLDVQFMGKIGNDSFFLGKRDKKKHDNCFNIKKRDIKVLKLKLLDEKQFCYSIVNTGYQGVQRLHETRVQIDENFLDTGFDYINSDGKITDILINSQNDICGLIKKIAKAVKSRLKSYNVNSIRILSRQFIESPQVFTDSVIHKLAALNKLKPEQSLKLEMELWFIMPDGITKSHGILSQKLKNSGITTYCNVPLLGGINDNPALIVDIAHSLRENRIEFHHLYLAGTAIQEKWNLTHPVYMDNVIDIASDIRRECSGREIPKYIILTALGEVDYGLTSLFVKDKFKKKELKLQLNCFNTAYFKGMDNNFRYPEGVVSDKSRPIININGLA